MQATFYGKNRHFYEYEGELYTATFPALWAETHSAGTGPKECQNCIQVGSWNGVFIGYCVNCAAYTYNYERGCGFINLGEESSLPNEENEYVINPEKIIRASDTYLYGICLDDIGDATIEDSRILLEKEFMNEDWVLSEDDPIYHQEFLASVFKDEIIQLK